MVISKVNHPLVSVISLSFNRRKNVIELMEALHEQNYSNFEIIVVDNNSQDNTVEFLNRVYPHVKTISCPENLGLVAYNFGFSNAQGDYIIIIDDDGLPATDDWISRTVAHFESNSKLGAIGYTIRMQDTGLLAYDSPNYILKSENEGEYPSAAFNGTGAALRAKALRDVGYYPFYYFRSWCELHLCTRLIDSGWDVHYIPGLEVWHCRTSGSINRPFTYYGLRNYFWYVWSFYPWPQVLIETIRYAGSRFLYVLQGRLSLGLYLKAIINAIIGGMQYPLNRAPITHPTLESLMIRRESDNNHGIVEDCRPFLENIEKSV